MDGRVVSARAALHAALVTLLPPDVVIVAYSRQIDPPAKSTVMLRLDSVRPSTSSSGHLDYEFALVLIAATTDTGPADDELEDLLSDVLFALEKDHGLAVVWTEATRSVYGDTNPAFEVPLVVTTAKESA